MMQLNALCSNQLKVNLNLTAQLVSYGTGDPAASVFSEGDQESCADSSGGGRSVDESDSVRTSKRAR